MAKATTKAKAKGLEPGDRVQVAAEIAERISGGASTVKAAILDVLNGEPAPAPEGADKQEPAADAFAEMYWSCRYLEALREAGLNPQIERPACVLRELRDEGVSEAGKIFDIIGDMELPGVTKELIAAAAVFTVTYWETRAKYANRNDFRPLFTDRKGEMKDLFLRCLGLRRDLDPAQCNGAFTREAYFFRKIHDLGGIR